MALRDLTDPAAVRAAAREFDELGRDAFLAKYGFQSARRYEVVVDGRRYDSKAIVGAAHGHQRSDLGPLPHTEFNGGEQTISKLRQLGFEVVSVDGVDSIDGPDLALLLARFLRRYATAREEPFGGGHEAARLLKEAAAGLKQTLPDGLDATVRASVGQGNWAKVPWIAVLDPRITTTTQHGVYPVVLVREDLAGLYVTIAQGVTDLKKEHGRAAAYEVLGQRASRLRPLLEGIEARGFATAASVDLGASPLGRDYAASVVLAKYFSLEDLDESSDFASDTEALNEAYLDLIESGTLDFESTVPDPGHSQVLAIYVGEGARSNFETGGRQGWWGWKVEPGNAAEVRVGDLVAFASGYSGGSPRVTAEVWLGERIRQMVVGRIDRAPFRTDEPIMPDERAGTAQYPWKIRFTILGDEQDVPLQPADALSATAAEAFRISAIAQGKGAIAPVAGSPSLEKYLEPTTEAGPTTPEDLRALSDEFVARVHESGLRLAASQVRAFIAGALAKPFVILTGMSGSGKTQLAKRLGEWCGEDPVGRPRYHVVPVRPDWTGPEFLFGYPDGLAPMVDGRTVWAVPDTLEFLLRAHRDPGAPYVLVLDEMNLAHVERYFADFLSGIESREPVLPNLSFAEDRWVEAREGGRLPLPANVIVVGTVNVDETTYMFSPKVLDRAFVHEFRVSADDLDPDLKRPTALAAAEAETHRTIVRVLQDDEWHLTNAHARRDVFLQELKTVHAHLSRVSLDFGHRVLFEALRFVAIAEAIGMSDEEILDTLVLSKLMPKIHGSRQRLETPLRVMRVWAEQPNESRGDVVLPRTMAKLDRMLVTLGDAQFVTFTE